MALRKKIVTIQGIEADYWRVTHYNVDVIHGAIEFELTPYVSQESRLGGNQPFESHRMITTEYNRPVIINGIEQNFNAYETYFTPAVLKAENKDIVEQIYTYAKNNVPFFEDAEDC